MDDMQAVNTILEYFPNKDTDETEQAIIDYWMERLSILKAIIKSNENREAKNR